MGFRSNAHATVWSVEPKTDNVTIVRISTTRKNRQTGEYEQDFSGFAAFMGSATARKAAALKEKSRIKLLDVEVCNRYDKDAHREYTYYNVWSFEPAGKDAPAKKTSAPDEVEIETDDMPF